MLSVLAVGPAGATGVGKYEPIKKDKKVCVKWVKVIKHDGKKFKAKAKFLWVKKSKFYGWKSVKDWDLKKDGLSYKFFKVKKIDSKKKCLAKNPKKFWDGKKPPEENPPPPPDGLLIEECLVHFTSSGNPENPINILVGVDPDTPGHEQHTDDDVNRLGTDFDVAGPEYPNPDADIDDLIAAINDADPNVLEDDILECDELNDLVDGPDADQDVIDALVELGDENQDNDVEAA